MCVCVCVCVCVCGRGGRGVGGGGEGGFRASKGGRVISKSFANWGGLNLFCSQPGESHTFFGKENTCRFY